MHIFSLSHTYFTVHLGAVIKKSSRKYYKKLEKTQAFESTDQERYRLTHKIMRLTQRQNKKRNQKNRSLEAVLRRTELRTSQPRPAATAPNRATTPTKPLRGDRNEQRRLVTRILQKQNNAGISKDRRRSEVNPRIHSKNSAQPRPRTRKQIIEAGTADRGLSLGGTESRVSVGEPAAATENQNRIGRPAQDCTAAPWSACSFI
jgi:hypothetical protein